MLLISKLGLIQLFDFCLEGLLVCQPGQMYGPHVRSTFHRGEGANCRISRIGLDFTGQDVKRRNERARDRELRHAAKKCNEWRSGENSWLWVKIRHQLGKGFSSLSISRWNKPCWGKPEASVEMAQNLASQDRKVPLMKPPRDPAGCAGIGGALPALPASGSAIGLAVGGVQSPRCTMWKRCESELDRHTHVGWTDVKEGVPSLRTRTWPDTPNVSISIRTSNTAQVRASSRVA